MLALVDEVFRRLSKRRGLGFGRRLNAEGHTVVALNEQGELTEYRPDGTEVPYEDLDQPMRNLRRAIAPIREAQEQRDQDRGTSAEDPSQRHAEEPYLASAGEEE